MSQEKNRRIMTSSISNMTVAEVRKILTECRKKHVSQTQKSPMYITDILSNGMAVQEFALKFQQGHHQKRHNKGSQSNSGKIEKTAPAAEKKQNTILFRDTQPFSKKIERKPNLNINDDEFDNSYFIQEQTRDFDEINGSSSSSSSSESNYESHNELNIKTFNKPEQSDFVTLKKRGRPKKSSPTRNVKRPTTTDQRGLSVEDSQKNTRGKSITQPSTVR